MPLGGARSAALAKLYLCGPVGDVTYSRERAVCGGGGCDCVSCSITMVHCEVGELDFVSKFDLMKGFSHGSYEC